MRRLAALLCLVLLAACAAPARDEAPRVVASPGEVRAYKAVVVAGATGSPDTTMFDNAAITFAAWLRDKGAADPADVRRFGTSFGRDRARAAGPASLAGVLDAVAALKPGAVQACLVFVTSHGVRGRGILIGAGNEVLSPQALDSALERGCGDAPTVLIVSGCYSGLYADAPLARPNRIVITASSAAQESFGLGARPTYLAFDECLQGAIARGAAWRDVFDQVRACVRRKGQGLDVATEPQALFGARVADLRLP
jgi:hypothetical protein